MGGRGRRGGEGELQKENIKGEREEKKLAEGRRVNCDDPV